MSQERQGSDLRVWVLAAAMAAAAVGLHLAGLRLDAPMPMIEVPMWALVLGFLVVEALRVPMHLRGHSHTVSLTEIPMLVGLVAVSPTALVAARVGTAFVAQVAFPPRVPSKRTAFNTVLAYLEAATIVALYRALLDGRSPVSLAGLSVGMVALTAGIVVGALMVSTVIVATRPGTTFASSLRSMGTTVGLSVVGAAVALGSLVIAWREPLALVGVLLVVGAILWVLRVYSQLGRRFEDLEALYEFTNTIDQASTIDELVEVTLRQCLPLFEARVVEVVMERGVDSTVTSLDSVDGGPRRRPAPPAALAAMGAGGELGSPGGAVGLAEAPARVREHYAASGVRAGMVTTLGSAQGSAMMIVVGLPDDAGEPSPDALRLFGTLARQARVAFDRVGLMDRLRLEAQQKEHQVLHDSLTGLPNRLQFSIVVEEALRRVEGPEDVVAVVLIDLDHFKEVNDTLGHQRGDVLLRETAMRLAAITEDGEHLARLGGDEFGVILRRVASVGAAVEAAGRFGAAVEQPFVTEGLRLQVTASIGIALAPDHGSDGPTLLRRAEVAMYEAKGTAAAVEVYDPQRDRYSTRRLALAAELREAVESGTIDVHYQPKVALGDGRVSGVEALSRWHHPRHGDVAPDEFIELAERTGLIRPLTEHVLRTAFRDAVRFRDEGHTLSMAVNIAPSLLVDLGFPDLMALIVGETDIDPRSVVLEVTESTMMTDSARARIVLEELDEIGVELSIDDFGTGYSSLSYLSALPVDEVKIDQSFVMGMAVDDRLASIVTSTTALAHALGLRVVAEGVENRGTWDLVREAGCELAQGYHVARPASFTDVLAWLASGGIADGERGPRAVAE